jgi:crossover junction endodeoxyribonuclease RusA
MQVRVNGIPAPQGSKRHVGNGRMVEASKAVGPWREAIRAETQRQLGAAGPERGPVQAKIVFWLPRPAGHYSTRAGHETEIKPSAPAWPDHRPDLDKLTRAVLDGLTAGGAFSDDCQVVAYGAVKGWASAAEPPGCLVELDPA